ncbi:MAG: hypothetical protein WBA05_08540 [Gordonia sp. (in: high G+C Gram-positive bacteria)]|uniref:LGFP repeat-containing protein n=1 Tax=Gordonia sp. (in: high G+C Gram-positive bacteria) TaxID=84139 RepID=UPI003C712132
MGHQVRRAAAVTAALALTGSVIAGCSNDNSGDAASSATSAIGSAASAAGSAVESAASGASAAVSSAVAGNAEVAAADGSKVTLTGAIAKKYNDATEKQRTDLGKALTGPEASGKSANGVIFQQFEGGVITAKNADAPAYITWGKIRDAWNVKRDASGAPAADGKGGSMGPLGVATSDETDEGALKVSTFEHGKITWDSKTDKVEVTVDGKVVPAK